MKISRNSSSSIWTKKGCNHSLSSDINDEIYLAGILHSMVNNLLYDASEPEE